MSNWSDLHWSMLCLIAEKLTDVPDHLAFSWVCSSWRSVALDIRPTFPCPQPALMFRGEDDYGYCVSLSTKRVCNQKLHIPLEDWYIGTYGGWLVTVHKNLDMSLYNPFSRKTLPLPSITTVPKFGEYAMTKHNRVFVGSAALSSSNHNVNPKDLTVMIAQGGGRRLTFAKPGDSSWKIIDDDPILCYDAITFYKGKFYAVGCQGTVVCDIGFTPTVMKVAPWNNSCMKPYLLESQEGELILVERFHEDDYHWYKHLLSDVHSDRSYTNDSNDDYAHASKVRDYKTSFFAAFKMDFGRQCWIHLKEGIGDQIFFVGFNTAFSLPAQRGEGNLVYFTDDYAAGLLCDLDKYGKIYASDMGVYNFENQSIRPHINNCDAVYFPPPMWAINLPW